MSMHEYKLCDYKEPINQGFITFLRSMNRQRQDIYNVRSILMLIYSYVGKRVVWYMDIAEMESARKRSNIENAVAVRYRFEIFLKRLSTALMRLDKFGCRIPQKGFTKKGILSIATHGHVNEEYKFHVLINIIRTYSGDISFFESPLSILTEDYESYRPPFYRICVKTGSILVKDIVKYKDSSYHSTTLQEEIRKYALFAGRTYIHKWNDPCDVDFCYKW